MVIMIMSDQLGLCPDNPDKAIQSKVTGLGQSGRHETKHIDYIFTFESWRSNLPQVFLFSFVILRSGSSWVVKLSQAAVGGLLELDNIQELPSLRITLENKVTPSEAKPPRIER